MAFDPNQRPAAPWSDHNWWGKFSDALTLPNMAASDVQVSSQELQRGDIAWSEADAALYYCDDPTAGAAVWMLVSAGGGGATGPAGGDLNGTYPNPTVIGIQGDPIIAGAGPEQILKFTGGSWTPSPESRGVLGWGQDNLASSITTRYLAPGWDDGLASVQPRQLAAPRSGTFQNMWVHHETPRGNENPIVYTLRVNGVPTAVTVSLASTGIVNNSGAASAGVVLGDIIDIEVTKAAAIGQSPLRVGLTMEFV